MDLNSAKIIGFNISRTYEDLVAGKGNRDSIYDCTRHYWANVKKEKAELADLVFGVANCKVVGVFKPIRWYYANQDDRNSRIEFEGIEIEDSPFLGMDMSDFFYRVQNPVRYIGNWKSK